MPVIMKGGYLEYEINFTDGSFLLDQRSTLAKQELRQLL